MKLLITTQKVDKNDPILGFFHSWIIEFSKHFESVVVICLYEGEHELPANVRVLSLGKETGLPQKKYVMNFYKYIWKERKNYDVVFSHMNQIYVVLGGLFWRIFGKKVSLWYTHKAVSPSLKIAVFLSNVIFTASKESFHVATKKLQIIGHGIDVERFSKYERIPHSIFTLVSVGRITRIKNLDILIEAAAILRDEHLSFAYEIVGPVVTQDDAIYFNELQSLVEERGLERNVTFREALPNERIGEVYARSNLNINLTPTGGVDKVVLEGIAAHVLPIVSNEAFIPVFGPYADMLVFKYRDPMDLAVKIKSLYEKKSMDFVKEVLFQKIQTDYSMTGIVKKISDTMIR